MRIIFLTLILSISLFAKPLKIAVVNIPPLINSENDQKVSGLMIDYLKKYIFINMEITWVKLPFARVLTEIKSQKLDGFVPFIKNRERAAVVTWLNRDFLKVHPALCFIDTKTPKVIAVLPGSPIPPELKIKGVQKVSGVNYVERALKMLNANRVDAVYHPMALTLLETAHKLGYHNIDCKPLEKTIIDTRPAFGKHVSMKLLRKFNRLQTKAPNFSDYLDKRLSTSLKNIYNKIRVK